MKKWFCLLLGIVFLGGCTTTQPLKAPCDNRGLNCSPRIKINQWNNA